MTNSRRLHVIKYGLLIQDSIDVTSLSCERKRFFDASKSVRAKSSAVARLHIHNKGIIDRRSQARASTKIP